MSNPFEGKDSIYPKLCSACCLGMGIAITSTYAALYGDLLKRADQFDLDNAGADPAVTYDMCGGLESSFDGIDYSTNWTMVYRFNTILYIILCCMLLTGCIGLVFPPFIVCIGYSMCGLCAQTAAIITGGIFRFRAEESRCAVVTTSYDGGENTWESDAQTYKALFIAQCSLAIPLGCFLSCAFQGASLGAAMKAHDGFSRMR